MKIRCKSCGKHFDPEVYSGLCPKCGTYNKIQGQEDEVSQYFSDGISGERAHRMLHEAYGDTGHAEDAHGQLHDRYRDTGHAGGNAVRKSGRHRISAFTAAMVFLLVLIPVLYFWNFRLFEKKNAQAFLSGEIEEIFPEGNALVFAGEPFESPVTVKVLGTETLQREAFAAEERILLAVWLQVQCEGYNFDASINQVMLGYELDGMSFYAQPIDSWNAEDYISGSGLSRKDILSVYGLGNEEQEGFFLFCVPQKGKKLSLLLMAGKGKGDSVLFQEGTIPLDEGFMMDMPR